MAGIDRRAFLTRGAVVAGTAAGLGAASIRNAPRARADIDPSKPNILVFIVDEMRAPQWFPSVEQLDSTLPNMARIRRSAVSFESHYTAANMCTPARGALVTGLYPHQTGCMLTNQSTLSPGFPTWGSMLRDFGYATNWYGKWHLGNTSDRVPGGLEEYGFSGGTYPSPNGAPSQGLQIDPVIADQFVNWFDRDSAGSPWCTTVSFVNPHDIQWWPRWTRLLEMQTAIPQVMQSPPPNFETAEQIRRTKPRLQSALMDVAAIAFGVVGHDGPQAMAQWTSLLNLYLWLQQQVDIQIGRVLDALEARPEVAASTVVIFTADHGDYAGSHGLHGKGGGAYEEGIRVPLLVRDPRGILSTAGATVRRQLTSSVDIAPFLLTIGSGGNGWRAKPEYAHIAGRPDIASICQNPAAPGRPWIAHVTDEHAIEEGAVVFEGNAPSHVVAVLTSEAKLATYSHWIPGTTDIDNSQSQEFELYDYSSTQGQLEIDNVAGRSPLEAELRELTDNTVIPDEVQAPLPEWLHGARDQGFADFHSLTGSLALPG
jgi:arylsulfatase A-like enzyme